MFTLQTGRKVLFLKKLTILYRGHMLLLILRMKKLLGAFVKKNWEKTNQTEFRVKIIIKNR